MHTIVKKNHGNKHAYIKAHFPYMRQRVDTMHASKHKDVEANRHGSMTGLPMSKPSPHFAFRCIDMTLLVSYCSLYLLPFFCAFLVDLSVCATLCSYPFEGVILSSKTLNNLTTIARTTSKTSTALFLRNDDHAGWTVLCSGPIPLPINFSLQIGWPEIFHLLIRLPCPSHYAKKKGGGSAVKEAYWSASLFWADCE